MVDPKNMPRGNPRGNARRGNANSGGGRGGGPRGGGARGGNNHSNNNNKGTSGSNGSNGPKGSAAPPPPGQMNTGDGFYRWADITFEWAKACDNEYERRAITSLAHNTVQTKPNHPLASKGKPMQLYIGDYADGKRQLCFSLRQIQYLQHYIYETRLTDPDHRDNRKRPAQNAEDDEKPVRHVPIPAGLIPADSFKALTTINVDSDPRKLDTKLRKENKRRLREADLTSVVPPVLPPQPQAPPSSSATDHESSSLTTDPDFDFLPPLDYFGLAQQAVVLAHLGGLKAEQERRNEQDQEQLEEDPATGRGLFIAVHAREQANLDGDPVLKDVGFDALYFAEDPEDPGLCTQMRDYEHWLIQEEIGFGESASPYLYKKDPQLTGGSLPKPLAKLKRDFQTKLVDLWKRAGKGPVYILAHSTDYDAAGFDHLGLDIDEIQTNLFGFANSTSNGNKFWIDTSRLFGEVENGLPGDSSGPDCRTARSVTDIMALMYGPSRHQAPGENAGNLATFTMKIFLNLVQNYDAKTFPEVRAWLAPKIAGAPATTDTLPPPPAPSSRTGSPVPAAEAASAASSTPMPLANDPAAMAKITEAANDAIAHQFMSMESVVDFPVDEDDSDWEEGGQFMVMGSDGELVPAFSDDE